MNLNAEYEMLMRNCRALENDLVNYETAVDELNFDLESKRSTFSGRMESIVSENVKQLQSEVDVYKIEIEDLEEKRNLLKLLNENIEAELKLKQSLCEENILNDKPDLKLVDEIEVLKDELRELNTEIDKLKIVDTKLVTDLEEASECSNVTELNLKCLEDELLERNKQILELECELEMSNEEIDFNCQPQFLNNNVKSLFSEVEEKRAEGITELSELKAQYQNLKKSHQEVKEKLNKMSQAKLLFNSRMDTSKENYVKYLQNAGSIVNNENKNINEELVKLEIIYNENKNKHITRNTTENRTVFDGMIMSLEKSLDDIVKLREEKKTEEMLLHEKCILMKQHAFKIEKELLFRQKKNTTVRIINDSLL